MATWTAAQWAVYAAKRDALYEGDIAACEADRDRRWKRAEALADAVDALQGPRPRRWLTRTR